MAVPVRKLVGGVWKALDPALHRNADGSISPAVTTAGVTLSGGGTGPLVTMADQGHSLALSMPVSLPAPVIDGSTITYSAVLRGVDLKVTVDKQGGFSQILVVHDAAAAADPRIQQLEMVIKADGLTVSSDPDGNLSAADHSGRRIFSAAAPRLWDSTPRTPGATVRGSLDSARAGSIRPSVQGGKLRLVPDPSVLAGPATQYPVYVDPGWTPVGASKSGWATVAKTFPASNYWNKTPDPSGHMQVGNSGGIYSHTLINFPIAATLRDATINDATLYLTNVYSFSCSARTMNVYAPSSTLTSSNATWNSWSSALGSAVTSKSFAHGYNSGCPAAGEGFDVVGAVRNAAASGKGTQTFGLAAVNEDSDHNGYKEFDANSASLTVNYNHAPDVPGALSTSPATACSSSPAGVVGDGPVSLYATVTDREGSDLGVAFKLWKTSDSAQTALASSTFSLTYPSGSAAVLTVPEDTLKRAADSGVTQFSWQVQTNDGLASSPMSPICTFGFDTTRTGAPTVSDPSNQATIGQAVTFTVAPPTSGTVPTAYQYQLNGGPPGQVSATNGKASITVTPGRFTNALTVTSLSAGSNFGDTATKKFNAAQPAPAADQDTSGDGRADLHVVGGVQGLPAGLWQAKELGNASMQTAASNIGIYGNGVAGDNAPADFTGAQAITGYFNGQHVQDFLIYYPGGLHKGSGMVISGSVDGSPLQPIGNEHTLGAGTLTDVNYDDDTLSTDPVQLANAGNTSHQNLAYPDLIAINGNSAAGYYLTYYASQNGVNNYQPAVHLPTTTPTGGTDWSAWTITSAQVATGTQLLLWNRTTGALYQWSNLAFDVQAATLTFTQTTLRAGGWNTGANLLLQAADIDGDGTADLWTVAAGGNVTPTLIKTSPAVTLTAQSARQLLTSNHTWLLNDNTTGTIGAAAAADLTGGLPAGGNSGATWHQGDMFSPDALFDGQSGALGTSGGAITPNTDFSIAVWAKPNAYGGTVLSQDGAHNSTVRLYADPVSHQWQLAMSTSDSTVAYDVLQSHDPVALGVWVHLTVVYQAAAGRMSLYDNSMSNPSGAHTVKLGTTGAFHIGDRQDQDHRADPFNGQIAQVQTWNAALSHSDVVALNDTADFVLFEPDNTSYPTNTTWTTHGAFMNFTGGMLSVTEAGGGTVVKQYGSIGHPNAQLVLQTDGNLVIYADANHTAANALWSAGINGQDVNCVILQADGNLVAYTGTNTVVWSSQTDNPGDPPAPTYARTGAPAVYNPLNQHLEVYFRSNTTPSLAQRWSPGNGWTAGSPPGTITADRPAAILNPETGAIEVYYNNAGRLSWSSYGADAKWRDGGPIGSTTGMTGTPAVIYNPPQHTIEVYYNDGGTIRQATRGAGSTAWSTTTVGGTITGSPSALFDPNNNNVEVYYHNTADHTLNEEYRTGQTWTWSGLGSPIAASGSPSALYNPTNTNVEVYFAGSSGGLTEDYWVPTSSWTLNVAAGATVTAGDPVALYNPATRSIEVYFNTGGTLTEKWWDRTSWHGPSAIGGTGMIGGPMAAYNYHTGNLEVFFSSQGALTEYYHSNSGWTTPINVGGTVS
ncbi:LamG-like jellyroll fold domain-containing protein [Dactylosporangium matsuzakiense]|nr:LamG-like jellyroll fold domain-containing protein [Dactylosporangium matsuzakiense]UWZ43909.1 hypothetical protein Dmats_41910 [Dactylosporangium matsuzakiense]